MSARTHTRTVINSTGLIENLPTKKKKALYSIQKVPSLLELILTTHIFTHQSTLNKPYEVKIQESQCKPPQLKCV